MQPKIFSLIINGTFGRRSETRFVIYSDFAIIDLGYNSSIKESLPEARARWTAMIQRGWMQN